ncbi:hypothetical protein U9M48_042330 [Paspalum notatum var. saurae]|uniref:Uncharacterized protein n=1 Tax=Paspalum notatum var. saurae TaxID=547442 RepID=A0AAQ3UWT0_PASNO
MHREIDLMETNLEEDEEEREQPPAEVRLSIADVENTLAQAVTPAATPSHKQEPPPYVLRRVPQWVREDNEHAYAPKFICIGPYHSGGGATGNGLRRVELKQRYANELLMDAAEPRDELTDICKQKLTEMEDHIRKFYGEGTQGMATDDLVEMMFLDGCFIIKHLYNYASVSDDEELHQSTWAPAQIRNDLCLLENQVPFAVLVALFQHLAPRMLRLGDADEAKKRRRLVDMALWYMLNGWWTLHAGTPPTAELQMAADDMPVDHLLHLLHEAHCAKHRVAQERHEEEDDRRWRHLAAAAGACPFPLMRVLRCLCLCNWQRWPKTAPDSRENIPSAAELAALGISIRMVEPEHGGLLDVRFRKDRVTLEIPSLYVEQTSAPLLQNLIAYEQQVGTDGSHYPDDYFTTYAFLMYNLVSTREDITLLQELRILHNNFGSDVKIIEYFKNLCMFNRRRGSTPLDDVLRDLRKCKRQKVYRDWAEMKNYINSPVKVLLLIISAMVALSTVLQALVAVRPTHL